MLEEPLPINGEPNNQPKQKIPTSAAKLDTKDDISVTASVSPMIAPMRGKRFSFRRLNTMATFNDVDIDNHLDYIKDMLTRLNYSLDQRMFSDLILSILDKILETLNVENKFNRIIFNYIIEFGNFKTDSPILL